MDIKEKIENLIKEALFNLDIKDSQIVVEHPADLSMGDYSTNVAMALAKDLKISPNELAEKIVKEIKNHHPSLSGTPPPQGGEEIQKIEVAGPGFINFYLSREFFTESIKEIVNLKDNWGKNNLFAGKKMIIDYTDPNPFKPFHIGHLMTNAIGESISRIFEFSGAKTIRANYQGDVGPHVAKAIWGINHLKKLGKLNINFDIGKLQDIKVVFLNENDSVSKKAEFIGQCYWIGSTAYGSDEEIKKEIDEINQKVYDRADEEINKVYDWGRKVTLEAFEEIYKLVGTKFDYYFFESEMAPIGIKIVKENMLKVFEESEGATVFKADKYDPKLHTRVFINSKGLPTYETKELGLTQSKFDKENLPGDEINLSIVVTAIEQAEYMKVVQKAISLIHPDLEKKMKHITHGMMRFASGKMSSRKGNVVTGESLLQDSMDIVKEKMENRELTEEEKDNISKIVGVASLKYSILKSSLGSDIIYDPEKSVSFEGDSGPYLQYTTVRANSIMNKALVSGIDIEYSSVPEEVTELEQLLYQFPEVVLNSYEKLEPHHIATYLTELASAFNSFYANTIVLNKDDKNSSYRVAVVSAFYQTMKNGLYLLGIQTPEKM